MGNSTLAVLHDSIPYLKRLRLFAGSVTATILMQQLDYWFEKYPEGFFKFLQPCEHESYKEGDSWTEELGFSVDEFRTAFDKIGIRHASKGQFDKLENVFLIGESEQEKFYASYHDKIKGLTFYYRNHPLVNAALALLIQRATEMDIAHLRKSGFPIYVNGDSPATELGNANPHHVTETTTEITYVENTGSDAAGSQKRRSKTKKEKPEVPAEIIAKIYAVCKLVVKDCPVGVRKNVSNTGAWLVKKYPTFSAATLCEALDQFLLWYSTIHWKGRVPQPHMIPTLWQQALNYAVADTAKTQP